MRTLSLVTALALAATPLAAQDDHDHISEADGLRIVHAWTPATTSSEALIYMEIENETQSVQTLTGAETKDGLTADLVGFTYIDGVEAWENLPGIPIAAGQHLDLAPRAVAFRLSGLNAALTPGEEVEMEVMFGDLHLDIHVAVEDEDAMDHSHAGHSH